MRKHAGKSCSADLSKRGRRIVWGMLIVLLPLMLMSVCLGRYPLNPGDVLKVLFTGDKTGTAYTIVKSIRLPRICTALMTGMALSVAGLLFQMVFHHPMATPDLLGTSSGASLGAALGILAGWSAAAVTTCSFIFGLVSVFPVLLIAGRRQRGGQVGLILTGLVIGSVFSSIVSCIKLLADESNRLPAITYWLMGSLSGVRASDALCSALVIAPIAVLLLLIRYRLNLLSMSNDEAASLGSRIRLLRLVCILCASILTAVSVSVCGVVGWVGLFIPNLCRSLSGEDTRILLPCSMLTGGLYLMLIDNICRTLLTSEIPLGILTAAIGAPLFLILYMRGRREE